ncbi:MAG: SDR family oxidoreductase [bacterium]|nr:SDR family oxidoreductase [bacterium]
MIILITGGAGFIGSHLCERLLQNGHRIICLDNFFTGSKKNIVHLLKNSNFKLVQRDIVEPIKLRVDRIYNLACPASPKHYQDNPVKTIKCSTVGMVNVLELAKRSCARVLQASTSEVYGDPLEHPQKETYWGNVNPVGPRSCYDEGKRVAETLCMDFHRQNGVETRLARIFNTYGPRMRVDDGRVVSNFIVQALRGQPLTIYGNGRQTRSFCYVDDLVAGLIKLMESKYVGPVNLGNPGEFMIKQLAELVLKMTNSKSRILYKSLPQDDPKQRRPDIALAKKILKWKPTVSLEQGLKKTIDYFKKIV